MKKTNRKTSPFLMPLSLTTRQAGSIVNPRLALKQAGLRQGMSFVDMGCGSGYFVSPAAKIVGDMGKIYAIDILRSALDHVKSKARMEGNRNIKVIWADLEKVGSTKIKPGVADMIFVSSTLHQVEKKESILEEAKRIMSPGGKLVIFEWETSAIPFGPRSRHRISEDDVIAICREHGLKLYDAFKPGKYHYGLVFIKE